MSVKHLFIPVNDCPPYVHPWVFIIIIMSVDFFKSLGYIIREHLIAWGIGVEKANSGILYLLWIIITVLPKREKGLKAKCE